MRNDSEHLDHQRPAQPWHEAMQGLPNKRDER
jgi:hypothetical protein